MLAGWMTAVATDPQGSAPILLRSLTINRAYLKRVADRLQITSNLEFILENLQEPSFLNFATFLGLHNLSASRSAEDASEPDLFQIVNVTGEGLLATMKVVEIPSVTFLPIPQAGAPAPRQGFKIICNISNTLYAETPISPRSFEVPSIDLIPLLILVPVSLVKFCARVPVTGANQQSILLPNFTRESINVPGEPASLVHVTMEYSTRVVAVDGSVSTNNKQVEATAKMWFQGIEGPQNTETWFSSNEPTARLLINTMQQSNKRQRITSVSSLNSNSNIGLASDAALLLGLSDPTGGSENLNSLNPYFADNPLTPVNLNNSSTSATKSKIPTSLSLGCPSTILQLISTTPDQALTRGITLGVAFFACLERYCQVSSQTIATFARGPSGWFLLDLSAFYPFFTHMDETTAALTFRKSCIYRTCSVDTSTPPPVIDYVSDTYRLSATLANFLDFATFFWDLNTQVVTALKALFERAITCSKKLRSTHFINAAILKTLSITLASWIRDVGQTAGLCISVLDEAMLRSSESHTDLRDSARACALAFSEAKRVNLPTSHKAHDTGHVPQRSSSSHASSFPPFPSRPSESNRTQLPRICYKFASSAGCVAGPSCPHGIHSIPPATKLTALRAITHRIKEAGLSSGHALSSALRANSNRTSHG